MKYSIYEIFNFCRVKSNKWKCTQNVFQVGFDFRLQILWHFLRNPWQTEKTKRMLILPLISKPFYSLLERADAKTVAWRQQFIQCLQHRFFPFGSVSSSCFDAEGTRVIYSYKKRCSNLECCSADFKGGGWTAEKMQQLMGPHCKCTTSNETHWVQLIKSFMANFKTIRFDGGLDTFDNHQIKIAAIMITLY